MSMINRRSIFAVLAGTILAGGILATAASAADEEVIRAVTFTPAQVIYAQQFQKFVDKVNEKGKGVVRIDVIGGPEVIPPMRLGESQKNGVADMFDLPAGLYLNMVPEGEVFAGSNHKPWENRENGGLAMVNDIFHEKGNAHILAHVDAGKTSLTERLLFETGVIRQVGSVDAGTTQTDTLELERGDLIKAIDKLRQGINELNREGRQRLLAYLRANRAAVAEALAGLPGIRCYVPEATYLAWIDCRDFARDRGIADLVAHFEAHGIGLSDGRAFGAAGFVRLNFGCPRALLERGLLRMRAALA